MLKKRERYVHPHNFLSNLDKRDRDVLQKAADRTDTKIYFEPKAFDGNSRPLKDTVAVFSVDIRQDHGDMWLEFNRIVSLARRGRIKKVVQIMKG